MPFWTYQNLATVCKGTWLVKPDDLTTEVSGLWHDTREIKQGQAYLAIAGDNFDGHEFIDKAFDAGAAIAIVSKEIETDTRPVLKVDDTVVALQDLARAYRDELCKGRCKVIGIAGSNGKTTTRHLIHHVLTHAGLKGIQSPKSFNNHLGVPLTLLQAKPTDDFVAAEIGTNHPGEIDFLSEIARPDIAVITSIGEEHLEFFKDIEGVEKEEAAILPYIQPNGVAITPGQWDAECRFDLDPKWLSKVPDSVKSIRIGEPEFEPELRDRVEEWYVADISPWLGGANSQSFIAPQPFTLLNVAPGGNEEKLGECKLNLSGRCNLFNATTAAVVAIQFGFKFADLSGGFISIAAPEGRGQITSFSELVLINDAYNANPSSMREAIAMMGNNQAIHQASSVLVLGDMFELGDHADEHHRAIGQFLAPMDSVYVGNKDHSVSRVILIGPMMQHAKEPVESAWMQKGRGRLHCFPDWSDDLPDKVAALLQPGDTVLLKASRGMRLERLIPAIEQRFGAAQDDQPT
jgi:UDP-N-acetylmuramoyl-tripeptide--D-alanyl-D-alanine ligase